MELSEKLTTLRKSKGLHITSRRKSMLHTAMGQPEVRVILRTGIIPVVWTQILFMKMRDTANFLLKVLCRTQRPLEFRQQLRNPPCGKAKI